MSLRLIELQVALPRTHDVGKIQEQLQQKGQHIQEQLASEQQKGATQKRNQVNKYDETTQNKLQNNGRDSSGAGYSQKKRKQNKQSHSDESPHPYKGNLIDIEG